MFRKLLAAILMGMASYLGAQPQAPAVPVNRRAVVELPAGLNILPDFINSTFEESAPMVSADGNILYFTRRRHPQNFGFDKAGDIWVSKRNANGGWSRPVNAGAPLNNIYPNSVVALDPGNHIIYLQDAYSQAGEGLAWAVQEGRSWSNPEPCVIEDFYTIGDGATFHLCSDGNTLIMGLERQEGLGRRDLYVSFRQGANEWSAPKHMGDVINTSKEESRAFLAADGQTLYFASRGHGGRGGFDLFYSRRLDDSWTNWSEPQNLGQEINTPFDDEYISLPATGDPAYLVYRDTGSLNIYATHLPEDLRPQAVTLVRGKVNVGDQQAVRQLEVTSLNLQSEGVKRMLPLQADGTFTIVVPPGSELGIQAAAPGYFPASTYLRGAGVPKASEMDQRTLLASTEFSPEYLHRDGEIQHLKLRLDQVDEELAEMRRLREAYLKEENLPDPQLGSTLYSDPELDALRHRYETLNRPVEIDTIPVPTTYDWEPESSLIPEKDANRGTSDDELSEMKERFNRFYQPNREEKKNEVKSEFLWEEAKGFADFQKGVHEQMMEEMRPRIGRELAKELWPQVKASMRSNANSDLVEILDEKEYEIREQIAQQLEDAMIQVGQSRIEMPSWQQELEGELRDNMEAKVRLELRDELRDEVRKALENEAYYQIRQHEAAVLNEQLKEKVAMQIAEEQQQLAGAAVEEQDLGIKGAAYTNSVYREEERELVLLSPEKGSVFTLNNVFFKPNTDQLKEVSYLELDRVIQFLVANPDLEIEIAAHTNGWLSHSLSLQLSEQRARVIADYLFSRGVSPLQVQYQGYGKTSPIASNDTLEGRRKNQRIELHILDN